MTGERTKLRRSTLGSSVFQRRLKVYFYTSNAEKLLQARLLFRNEGQVLNHFRAHREPYEEDYSLDKNDLLKKAIEQVRNQFLVRSIFFVEDTSIRIEALSSERDYPGLRAKEWFAETNFESIDELLKARGNDRRATVKSDIALHIPNLEDSFLFHGETQGVIADTKPSFQQNSNHPWLTPHTFNGWLIPAGETTPLGAMTFERSMEHDFRAEAIGKMLEFLKPLNAVVNLPNSFLTRDQVLNDNRHSEPYLPNIFTQADKESPSVVCVIGHKCAGKTTASEFVQSSFGASFYEASQELRAAASDAGLEISSTESALTFLDGHGYDIVAKQIIDQLAGEEPPLVIISGLRTVEELERIYESFPHVRTIVIKADRRIRFERHLRRGRDTDIKSIKQFAQLDADQLSFGLLEIAEEVADYIIINDGDLPTYYSKVNGDVKDALLARAKDRISAFSDLSETHRSLIALAQIGGMASCEEISLRTEHLGAKVWRYNTNRALKSLTKFVDRHDDGDELLSYHINDRGKRLVNLLNLRAGAMSE